MSPIEKLLRVSSVKEVNCIINHDRQLVNSSEQEKTKRRRRRRKTEVALITAEQPEEGETTTGGVKELPMMQNCLPTITTQICGSSRRAAAAAAAAASSSSSSSLNFNPNSNWIRSQKKKQQQLQQQLSGKQVLLCALTAAFLLAASLASADHAQQHQQQQTDGYEQTGASQQQQQQQQQQQAKAKKIQIVYIKVPLNKLKPSLANTDQQYVGSSSNETAYLAGQQQQQQHEASATDTQRQGSQSNELQQRQQQSSSFLIPMALVQTESQPPAASSSFPLAPAPVPVPGSAASSQINTAGLTSGAMSAQTAEQQQPLLARNSRHSMMRSQQQLLQPPVGQRPLLVGQQAGSINQGFMSSFLMAEKEKLTGAAMRIAAAAAASQQLHSSPSSMISTTGELQQVVDAAATNPQAAASSQTAQQTASPFSQHTAIAPSAVPANSNSNLNFNQQQQQPHLLKPHYKPGGLMPIMMMPFSHMPDNMIGQAYNAAVGQALPLESGSPMLSNSASASENNNQVVGKQQVGPANYQQQAQQLTGGSSGTHGDSGSSPSTGSSGSYGAGGPAQSGHSSSGSAYPSSSSASGAYGPSSGYGSGTNSFGASVAFSDYPVGSGAASLSSSNNNNQQQLNSLRSQPQHQQAQSAEAPVSIYSGSPVSDMGGYQQAKLRQAKKTIIPIVVQVEHAIMESNQQQQQMRNQQQQQPAQGNRFSGHQQRHPAQQQQPFAYRNRQRDNRVGPYGAASNEIPLELGAPAGAQYINAANAQDINQITAAINAENAASAAAALAQADMAFGPGNGPAYIAPQALESGPRPHSYMHAGGPIRGMAGAMGSQYLQSAASAILANTHPVLQAAASGGLASVSKLGAKLGEIMALPSMQVPPSIAALPSALSSLTSQMGVQLNQAVQQVAKEHPDAHYFARQVAQHAGIQLPHLGALNSASPHQQQSSQFQQQPQQPMLTSGSQQVVQSTPLVASAASQLQNLKLSIGHNLQSAAAQLIGAHQKANAQSTAAQMLANPLSVLYPPAVNSALKQLSAGASAAGTNSPQQVSPINPQQQQHSGNFGLEHHAQSSSVQQQFVPANVPQQQPQFLANNNNNNNMHPQQEIQQPQQQSQATKAGGKTTLKSKFLSFFQPPAFFSNLF